MLDLKKLRLELKQTYTQENVAEILSFIGYEINKDFKFKLRDEATSSSSISKAGLVKDFGSGFSGDVVSILHEYKNLSLFDSTTYVAKLLNIDIKKFEI